MKNIGKDDNMTETAGMPRHPASIRDANQSYIPEIERLVDVSILATSPRRKGTSSWLSRAISSVSMPSASMLQDSSDNVGKNGKR